MIHLSPVKNFQPLDPHQQVEANLLEILRYLVQDSSSCRAAQSMSHDDGPDRPGMIPYGLFLNWLRIAGRHHLYFGHPGSPGMTRDERQVIDTLASAQNHHWALLKAHLNWLAESHAHPALTATSVAIGRLLGNAGQFLMMPRPAVTIPHQQPWRLRLVCEPVQKMPRPLFVSQGHHQNQA